jgi:hypothetical protein
LVGGGAVVAVLSVVLIWAVFRPGGSEPVFPTPSGPYTFTIPGYDVVIRKGINDVDRDVYHFGKPTAISAVYQRGQVYKTGEPGTDAELVVYRPGVFDADKLPYERSMSSEDVKVGGRSGMLFKVPEDSQIPEYHLILVWEYDADAWATLETRMVADYALPVIAAGLRPGPQVPARLPFSLGYVPAGYVPIEVADGSAYGYEVLHSELHEGYGGVLFAKRSPPSKKLTRKWGASGDRFSIHVERGNGKARDLEPSCEYYARCVRYSPDGSYRIVVSSWDESLSYDEKIKILRGVQPATLDQPATWPLATDVLRR